MNRAEMTRFLRESHGEEAWTSQGLKFRAVVTEWVAAVGPVTYEKAILALREWRKYVVKPGEWITPAEVRRLAGVPGNYKWPWPPEGTP